MEVNEINTVAKLKSLQKRGKAASITKVEDKVTLSKEALEASKKAEWVSMLHKMDDPLIDRVIAEKIYQELNAK